MSVDFGVEGNSDGVCSTRSSGVSGDYNISVGRLDSAVRNGNISQPQAEQILRRRFLQLADEIERGQHAIRVGI